MSAGDQLPSAAAARRAGVEHMVREDDAHNERQPSPKRIAVLCTMSHTTPIANRFHCVGVSEPDLIVSRSDRNAACEHNNWL